MCVFQFIHKDTICIMHIVCVCPYKNSYIVCETLPFLVLIGCVVADVKRVVDLCAAPGSWSQVLAKKLR